jgi:hypothetical protein
MYLSIHSLRPESTAGVEKMKNSAAGGRCKSIGRALIAACLIFNPSGALSCGSEGVTLGRFGRRPGGKA